MKNRNLKIVAYILTILAFCFIISATFIMNNIISNTKNRNELRSEKYIVTFKDEDGTLIKTIDVAKNDFVTKPSDPTKKGYTFVNWQLDGKEYDFRTPVTKNITLIAIWSGPNSSRYSNLQFTRTQQTECAIFLYSSTGYEGLIMEASVINSKIAFKNTESDEIYYSNIDNVKYVVSFQFFIGDDTNTEIAALTYDGDLYLFTDYNINEKTIIFEKAVTKYKIKELLYVDDVDEEKNVEGLLYVLNENDDLLRVNINNSDDSKTYTINERYEDRYKI